MTCRVSAGHGVDSGKRFPDEMTWPAAANTLTKTGNKTVTESAQKALQKRRRNVGGTLGTYANGA